MPSSASGIEFRHEWSDDPALSHLLNSALSGGGVAVGDYDGDDLPDVLLTRFTGSSKLYRNLGDFRFEDVTDAAGLGDDANGGGAAFVDIDGDGDQDLTVCSYGHENRLYLNQGDGTFRESAEASGLGFVGASVSLSFADIDLDGDLDAYLLTTGYTSDPSETPVATANGKLSIPPELEEQFDLLTYPNGGVQVIAAAQFDRLYRNDGGTFTEITAAAGISGNHFGLSASFWDPDGDLWPDLYVANDFYGPDRFYRNQRDGTFAEVIAETVPRTPWFSMGSTSGDIDNDGRVDFLATDMSPTTHLRRMTNMGEVWASRWFLDHSRPNQTVRNALYLNTGTTRFLEASFLAGLSSSEWTWSPQFGDLDADGRLDLFVSNGMARDYFNTDKRREAAAWPGDENEYWLGTEPLRDVNLAFRNLGDLQFQSVGQEWGLGEAAASFGATLADFDRDGDLDVLINNFEDAPFLYRNGSTEGHVLVVRLVGTHSHRDGVGATVTITTPAEDPARSLTGLQTRTISLTQGYVSGVEPRAHFGLGPYDKVDKLSVRWPSGHVQTFTDLAADQLHVIAEPAAAPPARVDPEPPSPLFTLEEGPTATEWTVKDFKLQPLLPWRLSTLGPGLACGDIDGDGDDDVWRGGPAGAPGVVLINQDGALQAIPQPTLERDNHFEDMGGLLFDADADGSLDLFVASGGGEAQAGSLGLRNRLYLGNGDGALRRAPRESLPNLKESNGPVAAADVDRDGDLDLVVGGCTIHGAYPAAPPSRMLRNTNGTFEDATEELAPALLDVGQVSGALFSDLDDDGRIDLVLATHWGPVRLLRGTEGGFVDATRSAGLAERTGLWNGLASGDLDGDGDLDLVVTNLGLNTPYHASSAEPLALYHGDLDGSGIDHLVESTWADGVEVPIRCRECVRLALPVIASFFETHEAYGSASLAEIFGADVLASVARRSVTELRSGALINDGQGGFAFRPLPRLAQVAPSFGVALIEADGDGVLDLVLAQNFSAGHAEAGHWNGGLGALLLGDGQGAFRSVPADKSGIVIPDDGRGVAVTDLDGNGWADLIVACSDAPMRMLERATRAPRPGLELRLVGPAANANAVGARVTVVLKDGAHRVAEVTAGGGYLSQSSATLLLAVAPADVATINVRWPDDGQSTEHDLPALVDGPVVLTRD